MIKRFFCLLLALICFALAPLSALAEEAENAFVTLKKNDKNDEVAAVKLRLFHLGYFSTSKLSKQFNNDTVEKVERFQRCRC